MWVCRKAGRPTAAAPAAVSTGGRGSLVPRWVTHELPHATAHRHDGHISPSALPVHCSIFTYPHCSCLWCVQRLQTVQGAAACMPLPASHPPHHTPQAACPTAVEGRGRSRDTFTSSHPSRGGRVCDLHFHKAEAVLGWAWRVAPPSLRNAGVERSGGCKGTMLLHLCPAAPTPEAFVLPLKAIIFIPRAQPEDLSPDIWKAVQNFALTAQSECCSECKHPLFLEPSTWGVSFTLSSCCTQRIPVG